MSASKFFENSRLNANEMGSSMERSGTFGRSRSATLNPKEAKLRDNLASKLRKTLRPEFTMTVFQGGNIEGQREIMETIE